MATLDPLNSLQAHLGEPAPQTTSPELREARSQLGTARRAAHRALRTALDTRTPDNLNRAREALQASTDAATAYDVTKAVALLRESRGTTTAVQRERLHKAVDATELEAEDR